MLLVTLSVAGAAVVAAALIWFANRQMGVVLHKISTIQPPVTPDSPALKLFGDTTRASIRALEDRMDTLTAAVAEGIDHVDRNEKRVRGIITGARRRFEAEGYEDPGVEAEAATLPELDDRSEPEEGVHPLRNDVEQSDSWDSVPGMRP